jgi:thioredoxin 1
MFRRPPSHPDGVDATPEAEITTVTDASFMDDTAGEVAVIDFWAPWCAPCRSFAPIFQEVAATRSRPGSRFGTCNVDQNPATASLLGIQTIPTVVAFDAAGNEIARLIGPPSRKDLEALVPEPEVLR